MTVVTMETLCELACKIRDQVEEISAGVTDIKHELHTMRGACIEMQRDIHGIHGILARNEARFDRIERHLDSRR